MTQGTRANRPADAQELRTSFHLVIRRFGLLDSDRTPCGHPLPISQAHALMELLHSGSIRQGELAQTLGLSKSTVSRMVTQLESRGFVERKSDRFDGRVRFLILTVRGNKVAQSVDKSSLERFSTMLNGIPAEARGRVLDALEVLQRAIPVQSGEQQGHGDED